jgi:hypothetical protein
VLPRYTDHHRVCVSCDALRDGKCKWNPSLRLSTCLLHVGLGRWTRRDSSCCRDFVMKTSEIIPFPSEWLRFQLQIVDDLLNPDAQNLRIREGADGGVFVEGTRVPPGGLPQRTLHARSAAAALRRVRACPSAISRAAVRQVHSLQRSGAHSIAVRLCSSSPQPPLVSFTRSCRVHCRPHARRVH